MSVWGVDGTFGVAIIVIGISHDHMSMLELKPKHALITTV